MATIDKMLNPKTVAEIGASESEGSVGLALMKNLLLGKDRRKIYPVNPNRDIEAEVDSFRLHFIRFISANRITPTMTAHTMKSTTRFT